MEWSGKFSLEEYLALAQDISEEGTPDLVTISSFKSASHVGCAASASKCPARRKRETGSTWTAPNNSAFFEDVDVSGGAEVRYSPRSR